MARFDARAIGAFALLATIALSGSAAADPLALGAPSAPIPAWPGTGLWSRWASGKEGAFRELDDAMSFLVSDTSSVRLDEVGPVSLSNFILPLGDFAEHAAMPFSTTGSPAGEGPFTVGSFRGWWAARATGTFTLGVGSDDGYRIVLGGATVIDHPASQPFRRAGVVFTVSEVGLYPIAIDYFNGVQEGALEISIAEGDVGALVPTDALPASFTLIPRADLYPLDALADGTTVVPDPWVADAGAPPSPSGSNGDPAGNAANGGANGDPSGASSSSNETWRGGGCRSATGHGFGWGPSLLAAVLVLRRISRRRGARVQPVSGKDS